MTVLTVIGILLGLLVVVMFVMGVNEHGKKHFRYELFNYEQFARVGIPTVALYIGHKWYASTLVNNGDIYNGVIIMAIAVVALLYVLYRNSKNTNFIFGFFGTLIQFIVFIPLSFLAVFALMMLFAALSGTRPVYNLNSK